MGVGDNDGEGPKEVLQAFSWRVLAPVFLFSSGSEFTQPVPPLSGPCPLLAQPMNYLSSRVGVNGW